MKFEVYGFGCRDDEAEVACDFSTVPENQIDDAELAGYEICGGYSLMAANSREEVLERYPNSEFRSWDGENWIKE